MTSNTRTGSPAIRLNRRIFDVGVDAPYGFGMRLSDYGEDEPRSLGIIGLGLTEREAREVLDAITSLLASPRNNHVHVSSDDYQTEVRVFIVDDEGEMLM